MLSALLLSVCIISSAYARPSELVNNQDPAPAAELGPPGARDADRNPVDLKYDIIAIVGAWTLWTVGTVLLIIFVARPRRRRAETSNATLNMVMMKSRPKPAQIDPKTSPSPGLMSPKSPGRLSSLKSWGKKSGHKGTPSEYSISTVASFDEAHRAKNMEELSELYAAVMAHDEQKEAQASIASLSPQDTIQPVSPQRPPELQHLQTSNQYPSQYSNPSSNRNSNQSPTQYLSHPMAPTPVEDHFPEHEPHEEYTSRNSFRSNRTTPLSIISEISAKAGGLVSPKRPRHISIKNQRISQPMGSADLRNAHLYEESVPLSPRIYNPGPPPLTPAQMRQMQNQPGHPLKPQEASEVEEIEIHIQPSKDKDRRVPPALALRAGPGNIPSGAQTSLPTRAPKILPFREVYGDTTLRSAPPTKTTFLDRPAIHGGSGAPRTGVVPQTPYSPYMPFTPMTPITPRRLATREELKKARKEERLKVLSEDDLVSGDDDMWGQVR